MTVVAMATSLVGSVWAAPGETWSGTLMVSEQVSREDTNSSYDKSHITVFSVSQSAGFDDDPYRQPLASWSASYDEQISQGGECPSGTTTSGDAAGTDGELLISPTGAESIRIEIVNYGSPGTYPAESTSTTCEQEPTNYRAASTVNITHQRFAVESTEDPQADVLSGTVIQPVTDGTITYEWQLHRGENASDGDDDVTGTLGNDVIELFGGNDAAFGLAGDDKIYGGEGDDELHGDQDADLLTGGTGADTLKGGAGTDTINGDGPDSATVAQSYRSGHAAAEGGPDQLYGGSGGDRLTGGDGIDRFNGGSGRDTCIVDSRREKRQARSCEEIRLRRSR
ncbi:MAG: calcium-binding protein [Actinomycetota bacterium]